MTYFAEIFAKPIVQGRISTAAALGAIVAATARGMREGTLDGNGTFEDRVRIANHILWLNIRNLEAARDEAAGAVGRSLRPLIAVRVPRNRLMAEGHNLNGDRGFPLSEPEVEELVTILVWRTMQGERRHG